MDTSPVAPRIHKDLWAKARARRMPRVVAVTVFRRPGGQVLVTMFRDGAAGGPLCRPPGGGVRFGELARDAALREVREELGEDARIGALIGAYEDLFTHEGRPGHEVVLAFEAVFADPAAYQRVRSATDHGTVTLPLAWVEPDRFAPTGPLPLCPAGLAASLRGGSPAPGIREEQT